MPARAGVAAKDRAGPPAGASPNAGGAVETGRDDGSIDGIGDGTVEGAGLGVTAARGGGGAALGASGWAPGYNKKGISKGKDIAKPILYSPLLLPTASAPCHSTSNSRCPTLLEQARSAESRLRLCPTIGLAMSHQRQTWATLSASQLLPRWPEPQGSPLRAVVHNSTSVLLLSGQSAVQPVSSCANYFRARDHRHPPQCRRCDSPAVNTLLAVSEQHSHKRILQG